MVCVCFWFRGYNMFYMRAFGSLVLLTPFATLARAYAVNEQVCSFYFCWLQTIFSKEDGILNLEYFIMHLTVVSPPDVLSLSLSLLWFILLLNSYFTLARSLSLSLSVASSSVTLLIVPLVSNTEFPLRTYWMNNGVEGPFISRRGIFKQL